MATIKSTKDLNHHARADEDEANTHYPKLFLAASAGQISWKEETLNLEWLQMPVLPAAIDFVEGSNVPPTEDIGNIYVLINSAPHADWDGASQKDWVRFTGGEWSVITPLVGTKCYDKSRNGFWTFDGTDWIGGVFYSETTIVTGDVLTLNTAKIDVVAAPITGAIELMNWAVGMTFVSAAYVTNVVLQLITNTADEGQGLNDDILRSTVSRVLKSQLIDGLAGATTTQIIENKALQAFVKAGNPTAGDSDIIIYTTYRIINI